MANHTSAAWNVLPSRPAPASLGTFYVKHLVDTSEVEVGSRGYESILRLRHQTYAAAGKVAPSTTVSDMVRSGDSRSRIFRLVKDGVTVGSVKISVPEEHDVLETIDGALGYYPSEFPPKTSVIEVSALCIRLGYRRTDVMKLILEISFRALVESGRSHIIVAADRRLQAKYRMIAFRRTGHRYVKPESGELEVMISNLKPCGVYGLHADPLRWNLLLREIHETLVAEGKLRLGVFFASLFWLYALFASISHDIESFFMRRARKKRRDPRRSTTTK